MGKGSSSQHRAEGVLDRQMATPGVSRSPPTRQGMLEPEVGEEGRHAGQGNSNNRRRGWFTKAIYQDDDHHAPHEWRRELSIQNGRKLT